MILVRLRRNIEPEIIFDGEEKDIMNKINELDLEDFHDSFFYERGKIENLGLWDLNNYDYYLIYSDENEMRLANKNEDYDAKL